MMACLAIAQLTFFLISQQTSCEPTSLLKEYFILQRDNVTLERISLLTQSVASRSQCVALCQRSLQCNAAWIDRHSSSLGIQSRNALTCELLEVDRRHVIAGQPPVLYENHLAHFGKYSSCYNQIIFAYLVTSMTLDMSLGVFSCIFPGFAVQCYINLKPLNSHLIIQTFYQIV